MNKKIEYTLLISVIIISLLGIVMIYSSSYIWASYKYNDSFKYLKNQSLFFIIGVIIMILASKINYKNYFKYSNKILITCIILLILVLIPGIGSIRNGSRSWFGIGSFGIQPSEFTKLALIIFTSKYLSNNPNSMKNFKKGVLPILFITIVIFGIIMLQPDFGTGTILVMTIIGILFIAGLDIKIFIKFGILATIGVIGLIVVAPYRLKRILSFLDPWSDPLGSGFQIIQSLYSIGPGGLFGLGFGNSIQKHFYLPEPQTDFIFSIISEEFGFIGVIIISILFIIIFYNCLKISIKCTDLFGKYLSFGITFGLIFQTILNLSVVIGLIPVTGVTLPFLSYGGSSLIITMLSIGIILNISRYQN